MLVLLCFALFGTIDCCLRWGGMDGWGGEREEGVDLPCFYFFGVVLISYIDSWSALIACWEVRGVSAMAGW